MKIVAADIYDVDVQPWKPPIATVAAVQLDACLTNFLIQELVPFRDPIAYDHLPVPEGPGLGVTLNEELVRRCPHVRLE